MVCVTDVDRATLVRTVLMICLSPGLTEHCLPRHMLQVRLNDACRKLNKPFYSGGTYGLLGYIFCDLLHHDYIAPCVFVIVNAVCASHKFLPSDRSAQKDAAKNVKNTAVYAPLRTALQHRWTGMTRRQTKELNPAIPFAVLGAYGLVANAKSFNV